MLSAALAGIGARLICHPLDTVKTVAFTGFAGDHHLHPHQQSLALAVGGAGSPSAGGRFAFGDAARSIWRREGIAGLYRGIGVACVGAAPGVALYLTTYDRVTCWWTALGATWTASPETATALARVAASTPGSVTAFTGGFIAEVVSCLVWVPIDVSKERLQSQPPQLAGRYRGSLDAVQTIVRNEGVFCLYKGYLSTLASFGPFSAVYFVFYEFFGRWLRTVLPGDHSRNSFLVNLMAGAGGNIVASLFTNPLELIKTRLQVQRAVLNPAVSVDGLSGKQKSLFRFHYRGLTDGLATVAKEDGVRALWKGVGCRIAFTAPNAALTMAFYGAIKSRLGW